MPERACGNLEGRVRRCKNLENKRHSDNERMHAFQIEVERLRRGEAHANVVFINAAKEVRAHGECLWRQKSMKDVASCDKPRGGASSL